jgi:hypothetical protein
VERKTGKSQLQTGSMDSHKLHFVKLAACGGLVGIFYTYFKKSKD